MGERGSREIEREREKIAAAQQSTEKRGHYYYVCLCTWCVLMCMFGPSCRITITDRGVHAAPQCASVSHAEGASCKKMMGLPVLCTFTSGERERGNGLSLELYKAGRARSIPRSRCAGPLAIVRVLEFHRIARHCPTSRARVVDYRSWWARAREREREREREE